VVSYDTNIFGYSLKRYEAALGDPTNGTRLATNVMPTRPFVSGNGRGVAYVTADHTLALFDITNGPLTNLFTNLVNTMTISPVDHLIAWVPSNPINKIVLYDYVSNTSSIVSLVTPVFDDAPLTNIVAAGAMSFSPDGKFLAYTAVSISTDPDGNQFTPWSVFLLDVATLEIKPLIPPNEHYQTLQPNFSRTSSRYLLFEVLLSSGSSGIFVADLEAGRIGLVGATTAHVARASFNGDDTAIIYADSDGGAFTRESLYYQALSADKLSTNGSRTLLRRDAAAGVTYRRGAYVAVNQPPSVTITSPPDKTILTSPASFIIAVNASDADGSVVKVELYDGSRLLATKPTPPFTSFTATNFTTTDSPAGFHRYYVRAYDGPHPRCRHRFV
jgi:hypothetical protein